MRRAPLAAALLLVAASAARAQELPREPGYLWDPTDDLYEGPRGEIAAAVEKASQASGQRLLVVFGRPPAVDTFERLEALATEAWPGRTILFVSRRDFRVALRPAAGALPMLPAAAARGFEERVHRRIYDADFHRAIVNVTGDLGETLSGRPPAPWKEWQHPLQLLGGGRDARPAPLAAGIAVACGLSLALFLFLRALWRNPKRVLAEIAVDGAQLVIGGLVGGIVGGGSSFSGGGGSSGGGGANGSW